MKYMPADGFLDEFGKIAFVHAVDAPRNGSAYSETSAIPWLPSDGQTGCFRLGQMECFTVEFMEAYILAIIEYI